MRPPLLHRALPQLGAATAAGLALGPLDPATVGAGGLAAVWLAGLVAALVGLPLRAAQSAPLPPSRLGAATGALTTLLLSLTAAAALATALQPLGAWSWALAPLPWIAVAGLRSGPAGILLALVGLIGLVTAGVTAALGPIGWTLLEPTWHAWGTWSAPLGLAGLLAALVGLAGGPSARQPREHAVGIALALAALLAVTLTWASAYEVDFTLATLGAGAAAPLALALGAPLLVRLRGDLPVHHALVGGAATLIFVGPGHAGLGAWWAAMLPLGLALALALRAMTLRGPSRWALLSGALFAVAVAGVGWPSLPPLGASLVLGLVPALMVWVVGTRALAWRAA